MAFLAALVFTALTCAPFAIVWAVQRRSRLRKLDASAQQELEIDVFTGDE